MEVIAGFGLGLLRGQYYGSYDPNPTAPADSVITFPLHVIEAEIGTYRTKHGIPTTIGGEMSDPMRLFVSQRTTSTDVPVGVRFSAILLVLWACMLGLCGLFCLITVMISLMHGDWSVRSFGLGFILAIATGLFCVRAAKALRNAERWGANVAMVCGGLAVALGSLIIRDFFSGGQSADEYFLYPIAPIFVVLGAWLCIYLNMPRVRSGFEKGLD